MFPDLPEIESNLGFKVHFIMVKILFNLFNIDCFVLVGKESTDPTVTVVLGVIHRVVLFGRDDLRLGKVLLNRLHGIVMNEFSVLQLGAYRGVDIFLLPRGVGFPKMQTISSFAGYYRASI